MAIQEASISGGRTDRAQEAQRYARNARPVDGYAARILYARFAWNQWMVSVGEIRQQSTHSHPCSPACPITATCRLADTAAGRLLHYGVKPRCQRWHPQPWIPGTYVFVSTTFQHPWGPGGEAASDTTTVSRGAADALTCPPPQSMVSPRKASRTLTGKSLLVLVNPIVVSISDQRERLVGPEGSALLITRQPGSKHRKAATRIDSGAPREYTTHHLAARQLKGPDQLR